jgi:DNA-binding NarL/FixJ family response regulator
MIEPVFGSRRQRHCRGAEQETNPEGPMSSTTCVIVDDHPAIAQAVDSAFSNTAISLVGRARGVEEAVRVLAEHQPDVALVDLRLGDGDGFDVIEQLHAVSPRTRAVVFTGVGERASLLRAMELGVEGFVLKEAPLEELVRAVMVAAGGGTYIDPAIARELAKPGAAQAAQLTDREWEIIRLLARGLGNEEIGKALFISPATVRTHLRNGMSKLGASTRAQAVAIAYADGRIPAADASRSAA